MDKIDKGLLSKINAHFKNFNHEYLSKKPCRIDAKEVIRKIKNNEKILLLDIRTKYETSLLGYKYKDSLNIPLDELFLEENIKKLLSFKDYQIVLTCHSGARTVVATAFLHLLGIDNAFSLEGGISAFASSIEL